MDDEQGRDDAHRVPVRVATWVEQARPGEHTGTGFTEEVSGTGTRLHLNRPAVLGAPIHLRMKLSPRTELSIMGTVVWTRAIRDGLDWEVGVQFDEELPRAFVGKVLGRLRASDAEGA